MLPIALQCLVPVKAKTTFLFAASLVLAVLLARVPLAAQEITIAAASDLNFVLPELAARFERETGHKVRLSFGSSGNFFAQIQNGAPYDLFLSADIEYPQKLEAAGLVEPGTLYRYATGRLVLWLPTGSKVDVKRGLSALLDDEIKKIAIANPAHAPYGRAAVAAVKTEGIYNRIVMKLVFGENISQTAQFALTGNVDAAIIALSLAVAPAMKEKGSFFVIPQHDYPPLEQAVVVLRSSEASRKTVAKQFLDFLKNRESMETMKVYGFTVEEAAREPATKVRRKSKQLHLCLHSDEALPRLRTSTVAMNR